MTRETPRLILDLIEILSQGRALIERATDELYCAHPSSFKASSLGAHYRHHLEHAQLLLTGSPDGVIDYDARARDPRIEQDRAFALAQTDALIEEFAKLPEEALNRELTIVYRSCTECDTRPGTRSTLGRELLFLVSHAVHHYALMRILVEVQGQQTDETFGVMPSTLADPAARENLFKR